VGCKMDKKGRVILYGSLGIVSLFILIYFVVFIYQISLVSATLELGTNCGFVTEAPTSDPGGSALLACNRASAGKFTSPAGAIKIIEIGWWSSITSANTDTCRVGIYSNNTGDDEPLTLLAQSDEFSTGTTTGWKKMSVNFDIEPETTYWLAVVVPYGNPCHKIDYSTTGGRYSQDAGGTFSETWNADFATNNFLIAIYAVYETGVSDTCTCPGSGENWEVDMSDFCVISEACDLGTGTLSFTGAGWCKCNASVDTINLGDPGASGILYIQDSCKITID